MELGFIGKPTLKDEQYDVFGNGNYQLAPGYYSPEAVAERKKMMEEIQALEHRILTEVTGSKDFVADKSDRKFVISQRQFPTRSQKNAMCAVVNQFKSDKNNIDWDQVTNNINALEKDSNLTPEQVKVMYYSPMKNDGFNIIHCFCDNIWVDICGN